MSELSPGFGDSGPELSKSETGRVGRRLFSLSTDPGRVVAELFGAIDELPDKCKEIFKRSYVDGQEDKKIAEELDISLNTIKTQKQRAKSYLRGRLGDLFVYAGMFFPGL